MIVRQSVLYVDVFPVLNLLDEPPLDISLGSVVFWIVEYDLSRAVFNQLTQVKEDHIVGKPSGLPEDVGHQHDGVSIFEIEKSALSVRPRVDRGPM